MTLATERVIEARAGYAYRDGGCNGCGAREWVLVCTGYSGTQFRVCSRCLAAMNKAARRS